jgi:hypothetical protein
VGVRGGSTGTGEPICEPIGDPTDQFCSSCNQKKPLIDFRRFLTCNACRQRNTKQTGSEKQSKKPLSPSAKSNKGTARVYNSNLVLLSVGVPKT